MRADATDHGTPGHSPGRRRLRVAQAAVALCALFVLVLTLTPQPPSSAPPTLWRLLGAELGLADFIGNVALFLPLGIALGMACGRVGSAVLGAAVLSAVIEVSQGFFVPGRDASLGDLVANVIGGAAGGWIATHGRLLLAPTRPEAARLAAGGAAAAALVLAIVSWLMAPGRPSAGYEGQYSQHWTGHPGVSLGVVHATINGEPFAWSRLDGAPAISRELESRRVAIEIRIVPGVPFDGSSRLAAVIASDHAHASLARLEADGRDLIFSARSRAGAWGLRDPWVRLHNALPARGPDARRAPASDWAAPLIAGRDTLTLGGRRDGTRLTAWARGRTGGDSAAVVLGVARGWMLLVPASLTPRLNGDLLSLAWLALFLGPVLYWLARAILPALGDNRAARV